MKRFKDFGMMTAALVLLLGVCAVVFAENKSPMFSRQAPGGMFVVTNDTQTTGNIWFVDSGSSNAQDAAGYGQNPDAPFATLDYAIGSCTASNGDWIIVMPGHSETISAAGSVTADVAGIRIIGLGEGTSRPTFSWSAAAGTFEIRANNVSIENVVFDITPGLGKAATGVSLYKTVSDFKVEKCTFLLNNGAGQVTHAIYGEAGGTRTQIAGCQFLGNLDSTSGVSDIVRFDGNATDDVLIADSIMKAYGSASLINGANVSSGATGWMVRNVQALQANATAGIHSINGNAIQGDVVDFTYGNLAGVTKATAAKIGTSPL